MRRISKGWIAQLPWFEGLASAHKFMEEIEEAVPKEKSYPYLVGVSGSHLVGYYSSLVGDAPR